MSHFSAFSFDIQATPPLAPGAAVGLHVAPTTLARQGFNLLVELSTASSFLSAAAPPPRRTIPIMAHVDTGASITSIDRAVISTSRTRLVGANVSGHRKWDIERTDVRGRYLIS